MAALVRTRCFEAAGTGLWIGRPVELPGSRPLKLEIGPDLGSDLVEWPSDHVVKVLCFYHPDDDAATKAEQEEMVIRLADATRSNGLEMLLEIIPSKVAETNDDTAATVMERFYELGVYPDWWKLEPMRSDAAWAKACAVIDKHDPYCRGIVVLGLEAPMDELRDSFACAARFDRVKGFAVGRTIWADVAREWFANGIDDDAAVAKMADNFALLCRAWDEVSAKA